MQVNVIPGKTYAVSSSTGCTVTCEHNGRSYTLCTASGGQDFFVPPVDTVTISDDSAIVTETFKLAPQQKLTILGVLGGNNAGGLPAGYKRVEYLESTGTQYINANIVNNSSTQIWARFSIKSNDIGSDRKLFGAGYVALCIYQGRFRGSSIIVTSHIYDFHGWAGAKKGFNCGTFLDTATNETFETSELWNTYPDGTVEPTYIFSVYGWGRIDGYSAIKIFSFKATAENGARRNLIPALDPTGAPCMFDKVSKKPFYNQGTGDFLYPTESTTYSLRRVLPDWGKLTENGLCRLYHAPADWQGELLDYALEHGYKPISEQEMPEDGYWVPQWHETEEEIILEWVETEPPVDEFLKIPTEQ